MKFLFNLALITALCIISTFANSQIKLDQIDRYLIVDPQDDQESLLKAFAEFAEIDIISSFDGLGWYLIRIPDSLNIDETESFLKGQSYIKSVYRDQVMEYSRDYIPNDAEFTQCWHLSQSSDNDIDAPQAWDAVPALNPWVSVAMLDGGLDLTHPDLFGNIDSPYNAVTGTSSIPYVNQYDNHGTACSGTIAAVTNNTIGVSSVGNNYVKVMPINIMSAVYSGGSFSTTASIQIAAVNAAIANPNCVAIAMSYGGSNYSAALDAAFQLARTNGRGGKGMMVFASSGNGYSGTAAQYPANYSAVWGVGATSSTDLRASFSNYGQICDISAPGVSIRTTDRVGADGYVAGDYRNISGTSFSCPITAAVSALIAYKNWELTDDQILQILSESCEKVGGYAYSNNPAWPYGTRSNELGYGRINLYNAISLTPNPGGTPPPPPAPIHNFIVSNLTVSPSSVNIGDSLNIFFNAMTSQPTLTEEIVDIECRYSINAIWGDSDDTTILVTQVSLGNNISTVPFSIQFSPTGIAGSKRILVKINENQSYPESQIADNFITSSFILNDPQFIGTDVGVELFMPASNNLTTSAQIVNVKWKITNYGSTPITQITYYRKWLTCNNQWGFGCYNSVTWNGSLLPGQSTFLPNTNAYISLNLCNSSTNCAVPVGSSNVYQLGIITVNGFTGDGNTSNNLCDLTINRIATNEILTNEVLDEPTYTIYTVTGVELNTTDIDLLPSGVYIVKESYAKHYETYKILK